MRYKFIAHGLSHTLNGAAEDELSRKVNDTLADGWDVADIKFNAAGAYNNSFPYAVLVTLTKD